LDFYEDIHHTDDVRHLETKLGKLESEAACIIQRLHDTSTQPGSRQFTIPRSELQVLRKFIFIMHYRSNVVDKTYFQEDHPNNISVRNWIRKQKAEKAFTSDRDIWLQGLEYYLDTSHKDILAHAASFRTNSPDHDLIPHAEVSTDIPPEHWFSAAYETSANNYYLGIWMANQKSEFVLGHNSFGLWEGTVCGNIPQLFRIYVMSPMITLVLKRNLTKDPIFRMMEASTLGGIPLKPATTKYKRPPPQLVGPFADKEQRYLALQQHLKSSNAGEDEFSFDINRLSPDQTYLLNQVVLENLHTDGLLVFRSKDAMLDTANRYDTTERPFRKKNRLAIAALAVCLGRPNPGSASTPTQNEEGTAPPTESSAIRRTLLLNRAFIKHLGLSVSEFDSAFDDMLIDVLEGSIEFKNDYDRARYIHGVLPHPDSRSHPFAIHVFRKLGRMFKHIEAMQASVGPYDLPGGSPKYELVESLQDDDASYLLNLLSSHLGVLEKDWYLIEDDEGVKDEGYKMLQQVTAVAYLDLLVDVDHRLATMICASVPFMRLAAPPPDVPAPRRPVQSEAEPSSHGSVGPENAVRHRQNVGGASTGSSGGGSRSARDASAVNLPQVPTVLSLREPLDPGQNLETSFPQTFIEGIEDAPSEGYAGTDVRREAVQFRGLVNDEEEPTSFYSALYAIADVLFGLFTSG
jgi:hypothetical protein